MKVWVTRTQPWADETAAKLIRMGHEPVVQPTLTVEVLPDVQLDLSRAAALAFTSGHGVSAYAALTARRDLPVYVTAEATAAKARRIGFTRVTSAAGDVNRLAALIIADRNRIGGEIVWPGALEPAGDLCGQLIAAGVTCSPQPVYRTVETAAVPPPAIDAVLVHSARAAAAAARRLPRENATGLTLYAISENAAEPLKDHPFGRVAIAAQPNETALLNLIGP